MGKPARVSVAPRQSLGQNFLTDDNIARNIVRDLRLESGDVVVEIGPGHGALTRHLGQSAAHVTAVEIDGRVIKDLTATLASTAVDILHADFLKTPLARFTPADRRRLRLVGNIPYHLTSPILFKSFDDYELIRDLTIMVQREVARRIVAPPSTKDYGILSVFARFYGVPRLLFDVSPNCFYPRPKVTSTVMQIAFFEKLPYTVDTKMFREIVKTSFGKRRKKLRNSLAYLPCDPDSLDEFLRLSLPTLEKRPEQLHVEEFAELTRRAEQQLTWPTNKTP